MESVVMSCGVNTIPFIGITVAEDSKIKLILKLCNFYLIIQF